MERKLIIIALAALPALLSAQNPCGDVSIVSLVHAPFFGSVQVTAQNNGSFFFGYPQFSLVDTNADTVATEQINFFGLAGGGTQLHTMEAVPGAPVPADPFTGTLVLKYTGMNGDSLCTFPIVNDELCPQDPCMNLILYAYLQQPMVTTDLDWTLVDDQGVPQGQGSFHLDALGWGQDHDTLCLPPGNYTWHVEQPIPAGTSIIAGAMQEDFLSTGPTTPVPIGGSVDIALDYYPECVAAGQGIEAHEVQPLIVVVADGSLVLRHRDGASIGEITIFDGGGRSVHRSSTGSSEARVALDGLAPGLNLVRTRNEEGKSSVQRIILQ
jgi:hypothetical protein